MAQTTSTKIQWIAERAKDESYVFASIAHHITEELLHLSHQQVRKDGAAGVDGETAKEYGKELTSKIKGLHERLRGCRYEAPPVRRAWIPKEGGKRPLGIPTFEDKIVQRAVVNLLEGIYENDFYEFSYGYRKGRSSHQALEYLRERCAKGRMRWLIDADIKDYFTSIDHEQLREFLSHRISDGGIHRLIGKWLNAGVLEEGKMFYPDKGTPQGGVISPLLANLYLHYVLDEWFEKEVKPRLKGKAFLVRVADDFVIGCELEQDAKRIMEVLPKRMLKYGLTIHATKTKLVDFRKPTGGKKGASTFDFLGFRHYWGKSREGYWVLKKKTAPSRLKRTLKSINQWCRFHRHDAVGQQHAMLKRKLQGHYNYYGITFNLKALQSVYFCVRRLWRKWLCRRGSKPLTWERYEGIMQSFPLPLPRIVHPFTALAPRIAKGHV